MVAELVPGADGSSPSYFTTSQGIPFFSAYDAATDNMQLWRTDGTAAGTVMLTHDTTDSNFGATLLTDVNGTLMFSAHYNSQLWKSDGTVSGTTIVRDFGRGSSAPMSYLTNVNGVLYFSRIDNSNRIQLWKSDGTDAGTVMVHDFGVGGSGWSIPMNLTEVNGTLYFTMLAGPMGAGLWKSDGTDAGTEMIFKANSGAMPARITNVNGAVFFVADDGVHGTELWKTDGTTAGTVMVHDVIPGSTSSYPDGLTNLNGTLLFSAYNGNGRDRHLWRTDGTAAGTVMVENLNAGNGGLGVGYITNVNGTAYFAASDGSLDRGGQLWKSDGTAAGTTMVSSASNTQDITDVSGNVLFWANDGTHGMEPWQTDGTTAGTTMLKDINPGSNDSFSGFGIPRLDVTVVNGSALFSANDGTHGTELWKTATYDDSIPPLVTNATFATNPLAVNQTTTLSATVTDNQGGSGTVSAEYFTGSDPGNGNGTPMSLANDTATAAVGPYAGAGMHTYYVRAQDAAGNWSTPVSVTLDVYNPAGGYAAGHGTIVPNGPTSNSNPSDNLPVQTGNNIKATFDFTVRYASPTSSTPSGSSVFTWGSNCNSPHNNCFVVTTDTTTTPPIGSLAWLIVPGDNTATFQGTATLRQGATSPGSNYPVKVVVTDATATSPSHYTLQVFQVGSNPSIDAPLYQASGDLNAGNVVLHR